VILPKGKARVGSLLADRTEAGSDGSGMLYGFDYSCGLQATLAICDGFVRAVRLHGSTTGSSIFPARNEPASIPETALVPSNASARVSAMPQNGLRVLVTGASGPIGAALLPSLKASGYQVTRFVRGQPSGEGQIQWDPSQPIAAELVSGFDAAIHLAGETIVGRWTDDKRARVRDSRTLGTRHLAQALAHAKKPPRVFISGSAIGFYGDRGDEILREDSAPGQGFLAEVCQEWEAAARPAKDAGIRTANLRTGLVLSADGGALPKMLPPFKFGLGGRLGSGRQWWSWIHVQDLVGAMHHIMKSDLIEGPVNGVAPGPVTNGEFTKTLGSVLSRPTIFPVPEFALALALGRDASKELLLSSQRVEPALLVASGYPFHYSELKKALQAILR